MRANSRVEVRLHARNLVTAVTTPVDPTTQDQLDPAVHDQRVVWQDLRDAGAGEIYFKNLATAEVRRITDD